MDKLTAQVNSLRQEVVEKVALFQQGEIRAKTAQEEKVAAQSAVDLKQREIDRQSGTCSWRLASRMAVAT